MKPCIVCGGSPEWVRRNHVADRHFFCDGHAQLEVGFGDPDPGNSVWEKLDPLEVDFEMLASPFID